jgi:predicted ATPase/class 3 adenylate cyclase
MQEIADWLEKLGMSEYAQCFAENRIDLAILPELSDQDLKDLGVVLGDRRKILRAIADLTKTVAPNLATEAATIARPQDAAERRQVTVMFSDLVGSTALSARMDPEDLREVISAYQKCVTDTVQRFGGFVAKYMGDGVLLYFGYPQAHEDDAERAVRAGLVLVAAVGALKTHAPLQTRIGIATGLVVVGDLIGSGASQEEAIVGETPNLAARLQGIAEPNSVVIADSTRKLVGNLFELEDLGSQELKGISGVARAWAAVRPASVESRFDALHTSGLTELVGREEELEILLRRWSRAKAGEGQVVLLSGEPGIGKSRLTAALMERLAGEPHTRLRYFCSPQHTESALYPIISQMKRAAGFTHEDNAQAKLDKLHALLAPSSTTSQDAALLAEMLSLPNDESHRTFELDPQQRRQRTLQALTAQIEALSRSNPVLMIFEDVHWIDPTSLEALGRILDRLRTLGVLLIATYRPEFEPPWIGRHHVTALTLNRLGESEMGAMIDHVTGNKPLPKSITQDIIERTDGIPLFVEEMTKAVLEADNERDTETTIAAVPTSAVLVPASLHASLMARLDRLSTAKQIGQIGAAIGREFSYTLLAVVAGKTDAEVVSALDRIVAAGLLFRQGVPPQATYLFKHALVQEAAYGSLLRAQRQDLHARIAEAYTSRFTETARTQPELIAYHFTQAGMSEPAIDYWRRAGDLAMARSANAEAIHHFSAALELVPTLNGTPEREAKELELCVKLGPALMIVKGMASSEVHAIYTRAAGLRTGEDSQDRFKALWGLFYYSMASGRLREAATFARELLMLAQRLGADDLVLEAYHAKWATSVWCGEFSAADLECGEGISRYDRTRHHALAFAFSGHDPGSCAHVGRAISRLLLGFPNQAIKLGAEAVRLARSLAHPYSLAHAMWVYSIVLQIARQEETCRMIATELLQLSREHHFPAMLGNGLFFAGWARAEARDLEQGSALMEQGLGLLSSSGRRVTRPYMQTVLGRAKADLGKLAEAFELVDEALRATDAQGERWSEAEVHHVGARLLMARGQFDESEVHLWRSIEISRSQKARAFELRTSISLARLWRDQGKVQQARELLAPVYGWFTEGFDTRDLKEAKALLDELTA